MTVTDTSLPGALQTPLVQVDQDAGAALAVSHVVVTPMFAETAEGFQIGGQTGIVRSLKGTYGPPHRILIARSAYANRCDWKRVLIERNIDLSRPRLKYSAWTREKWCKPCSKRLLRFA